MPTYDYRCVTCESVVSVTSLIMETPKTPSCLSCMKPMDRVYGGISVTFKGNGWASKDGKSEISYNQSDNG